MSATAEEQIKRKPTSGQEKMDSEMQKVRIIKYSFDWINLGHEGVN